MAVDTPCCRGQGALAHAARTLRGFTPGDRMKKMGVDGLVSSKDLENSTARPSTYLEPSFSSMKVLRKSDATTVKVQRPRRYSNPRHC